MTNGSSYWGDRGANLQYAWPPGQNFPIGPNGQSDYGDSLPGWNFPNGWGSINVYNFALDLNQIENEKGFDTVNATTNAFATPEWTNLELNQTYTIDVNATSSIGASNPVVTVEYFPQGHSGQTFTISGSALTAVINPTVGLRFTLNTGAAPFAPTYSPGLLIFTLGNSTDKNVGFGYDFLNPDIAPGPLTVTVLNPGSGSMVGGCASANLDNPLGGIGGFGLIPGLAQEGLFCVDFSQYSSSGIGVLYSNVFEVKVTNALGQPVDNAHVTATVPQCIDLAFTCSKAELESSYYGRSVPNPYDSANNPIVSSTYTNLTGVGLVETSNMAYSAPYNVDRDLRPGDREHQFRDLDGPEHRPDGSDAGKYAEFNPLDLLLWYYHGGYTNQTENQWIPNFVNTSSLYDTLYGWQGQVLSLHITNSTGAALPNQPVWLGTYDAGHEYKFERYAPTAGILGITNSSNTGGVTDPNGNITLEIPDNESDTNYFGGLGSAPLGIAAVAVSQIGTQNQSFNYHEPCTPDNRSNPNLIITCQYNNSFYRNYTATPMWILPNPVNVTTMTPGAGGAGLLWHGDASLLPRQRLPADEDPIGLILLRPTTATTVTRPSGRADSSTSPGSTPTSTGILREHHARGAARAPALGVVRQPDGELHPRDPRPDRLRQHEHGPDVQLHPPIHRRARSQNENLNQNDLYTPIPYLLNWSLNIPSGGQISNLTFNSSLEITYLGAECPAAGCLVVNYSIKVNRTR